MSIESAKVLRNGKVLTNSSQHSPTKSTNLDLNSNMESSSNSADETNQSGRNSPINENSTQRDNEGRFNRLHDEMAMLKAMMEKIISQNEERDKQNDGSTATSSYAVGTSNMVTGVNRTHRNHRNQFHEDEYDEDYKDAPSNTTESALLNAIQDLPRKLQKTNTKLLQTHVPNFCGTKDKYNEFEHLLLNHFRPTANKITEEDKIHLFRSLLRDEAIDFWQTITISSTTTLQGVLQLFRKEFAKEDMREVAQYKWNEAKYDPTTQTFGDFLKDLKKIAKQAYGDEADKCIKMFLFGKLPVEIQQDLTMTAAPKKSKHTCSENTSTRTYFNKPHPRTNHSTRCLITPQRGKSHDLTKPNPKPRPNDSKANVSIVENKDIENKNAEDDNEMRLMAQPSQTPYNQPNDRKTTNQNTTQNSFARFADTLAFS